MNGALNHRLTNHCNPSGSHARLCVYPHQLMIALDLADKEFCTSRYKALHARFHHATASMFCRIPGQISSRIALESLLLIESDARSPFSCAPQWAVVNDDFQIIELSNELSRFLKVSAGRFQNSIVCLARDSLQAGLRGALQDARRLRHQVVHDRLLVYRENGIRRVSITVQPIPNPDECDELLVVVFQELGASVIDSITRVDSTSSETLVDCALIHPLKQELLTTPNDLEHTVQALQASNAELKASNEKLLSIIKKLQASEEASDPVKVDVLGKVDVEAAEPFTRSVIDSLYCFVGVCDTQGNMLEANRAILEANGLTPDEVIGTPFRELHWWSHSSETQSQLDEAITQAVAGHISRFDMTVRRVDERLIIIDFQMVPMRNTTGTVTHLIVSAIDVTERKRHEAQLLAMQTEADAARCAAEQASRLKSECLANMSHEIRTPMTAILGYADLLALKIKHPDNLQSVQTIKRNGQFLVDLLDDILDLSRIEAGKMILETRVFDPTDVVEQTRELMQIRAEQQRLTLCVKYVSKLPSVIHTDPKRVRQILVNLISNAIKFTEQGSVTLQVDYVTEPEPSLRFSVIDTGIGMDDKQCTEVLEAYTQADSSICRRFGGSGLGLAISKRLINMLGGHLSIDSKLGAGTAVTVLVPVGPVDTLVLRTPARPESTMPAEISSSIRLPYRILILDDQRDVRQVVQSVLEEAGAEVISANNGDAALRYFSVFAAMPIDAMVLDMHMPGVDGFEVTRHLRASGAQLPIIALTADAMLGTREKCLAAGCTDYFTKPINHVALLTCLHRHLQKFSASNGGSHSDFEHKESPAQPPEKLSIEVEQTIDAGCECILVIDDHHDSAHILASLLKEYGHTVRCAGSAREARAQLEFITPSLVLSDINLPDEDGYSLVASLRKRPELTHCRFIALTGYDTLDRARGKVFEAHIVKPFDIEALLTLIGETGASPVSGSDETTMTMVV